MTNHRRVRLTTDTSCDLRKKAVVDNHDPRERKSSTRYVLKATLLSGNQQFFKKKRADKGPQR